MKQKHSMRTVLVMIFIQRFVKAMQRLKNQSKSPKNTTESTSKIHTTTQLNSTKLQEGMIKQLNSIRSQILTLRRCLECSCRLEGLKNSLSMLMTRKIRNCILGSGNITSLLVICSRPSNTMRRENQLQIWWDFISLKIKYRNQWGFASRIVNHKLAFCLLDIYRKITCWVRLSIFMLKLNTILRLSR